jgi:Flp pilus assembly protein TadG
MVEVALLTPLLLALVLGAIEIGRYAYISILVGNAAHAGAMYGAQSLPQSADTAGIQKAADNDFQNNGQGVASLAVTSWISCGCDNAGTITYQGQTTAMCSASTNPTLDPSCTNGAAGHWVVVVNVTASGTFKSLFNYPWIPGSITVSRTSTMRVALQ